MKKLYKTFCTGDMRLFYILDDKTDIMGFTILPESQAEDFMLEGEWKVESLIQLKRIGDDYPIGFSNGHTMRNSGTSMNMKFHSQEVQKDENDVCTVKTVVINERLKGIHVVSYSKNGKSITVQTLVENIGNETEHLEMLSSFSLCSLFGISRKARTEDFVLHRMRSKWSEEGRLQSESFLELQMEPSWQKYGAQSIRFGQIGSMPVRKYFPWAVIEDQRNKCMLGVLMDAPASWQIEIFSEDDRPAISGGIADREFGHWIKKLKPGEILESTGVQISVCEGDLDEICYRLTEEQRNTLEDIPDIEKKLPVIFNEFCASWGTPTEEKIRKQVQAVKEKGITYFVIDAGWHADPVKGWESNMGDWIPSIQAFPNGLKSSADMIRKSGMIPGLWFEVETAGRDADVYYDDPKLLKRDGYPITTGRRRFLDLRKKEVQTYLEERVINCLKENGFGYLKVDYNDNIGIGCDGAESLGAGLQEQIFEAQNFYRKVRKTMPELVMENCSSGGHRLEPSMLRLFSMASFSDAHECVSEPIIAANVLRAVVPAKSQIWAVMRPEADEKRIRYLMAGTFLGRMCLSGDVEKLKKYQWDLIETAICFYKECTDIIRNAKVWRRGPRVRSYGKPTGYQMIGMNGENAVLLIIHTFTYESNICEKISGIKDYRVSKVFGDSNAEIAITENEEMIVRNMQEFDGMVVRLERI